jgi:uncharacterized protein YecE (DUF72 family)
MRSQEWKKMKEYLIGTGGWAYFRIPRLKSLVAYSRVFNFVEVNSTFYQMPPLEKVERWRKLVPPDFKFSVRAHQAITHRYKLEPVEQTFEVFEQMEQICGKLGADILHLQVPSSFKFTNTSINNLRSLLSSVNLQKLRLALEMRGKRSSQLPIQLIKTMQEHNIIHCVDLSKSEAPTYESDILYTRLFGKGKHNVYQPTDDELQEIDKKAMNGEPEKTVMSFHFVKMYKDAARLKTYKQTGKFPRVTGSTGLASLEEILGEDARFPSTREELVRNQGWKVFDLTENERVHARDLLDQLPKGTYNDLSEVSQELKTKIR